MRILVTGGSGMVGRSLLAHESAAHHEVIAPSRAECDLLDQQAVLRCFRDAKPDVVIHAAAKVGGIQANMRDQDGFLVQNSLVNIHVIEAAHRSGIEKLLYLGSSCMYPKDHRQPLIEEDVLAAPLEPTNEGYALAKIMGSRHCRYLAERHGLAYRTIIPSNLYGPFDHFSPERSHLVAACLHKVHEAKLSGRGTVEIWGDGEARREFLFAPDLAGFLLWAVERLAALPDLLNVGAGMDHSINEYYQVAARVVGYTGTFIHDRTRPAGMRRKLMDSSRAQALGWAAKTSLECGMSATYDWYIKNRGQQ